MIKMAIKVAMKLLSQTKMSQLTDLGALELHVNRWNSARLAVWEGAARQRFPRRSATVTFSKRKIMYKVES